MQIISGEFKGRKLDYPAGARPTSMRAKIALFNILIPLIKQKDLVVWDVYAGSGAFGAEFISRRLANTVIFTDSDPQAIKIISKNLKDMNNSSSIIIKHAKMPEITGKYAPKADIIFIDPPYGSKIDITLMANLMKTGTILIIESEEPINTNSKDFKGFITLTRRKYGRASFVILEKTA